MPQPPAGTLHHIELWAGAWGDLSVLDRAEQVTVPALHIGGWFDIFAANTARSFTELRSRAGTAEAREGQRLIIGPWVHLNSTGIETSRSNFPRFDRNSNTGGLIADESASEVTVAVNRVLDGPDYPSRLILPVIRR